MCVERIRRSVLISPAHKEDLIKKLSRSSADVCLLELEDGVHPTKKDIAREAAKQLLVELDWGPRERVVRINRVTTREGAADIAGLAASRPDGLLLPKVESEAEIAQADELLSEAEAQAGVSDGTIRLWSMMETAKGLGRIEAIAEASPRMSAIIFGAGDYGADIRVKRLGLGSFRRFEMPSHEYLYGRGRVVAASRAAGLDPIDVGHSTFGDLEGTRRTAEIAAQMGFAGSVAWTPKQVPVINEVFSPPPEDIEWATEVVMRFETEGAKGDAGTIVVVNGDMVDGPFVINARDILSRRDRIRQFEAGKVGAPG